MEMEEDAFNAYKRAKDLLPTDDNITETNRAWLRQLFQKFERENEKWKKTGSIEEL
jgi:hypothetical protein